MGIEDRFVQSRDSSVWDWTQAPGTSSTVFCHLNDSYFMVCLIFTFSDSSSLIQCKLTVLSSSIVVFMKGVAANSI